MTSAQQLRPCGDGTGHARPAHRVALVTGGTRGIGAAVSQALAGDGTCVAAGYRRNHEAAEKFAAGIRAEHPSGLFTVHEGNIGVADDCRRVVAEVIDRHGRLDILVNNAGIAIDKTATKMADDDWHKVIAINLSGAFFIAQAAMEHMIGRGTGRIVNVSSVIGETGNIGQVNYAASKSGLFGLTKSLAREAIFQLERAGHPPGDGTGVTVNAVTPRLRGHRHADRDAGQGAGPGPRPDPDGTARPSRGGRPSGQLPCSGGVRVHHRAGLGRQRRPGHVSRG